MRHLLRGRRAPCPGRSAAARCPSSTLLRRANFRLRRAECLDKRIQGFDIEEDLYVTVSPQRQGQPHELSFNSHGSESFVAGITVNKWQVCYLGHLVSFTSLGL